MEPPQFTPPQHGSFAKPCASRVDSGVVRTLTVIVPDIRLPHMPTSSCLAPEHGFHDLRAARLSTTHFCMLPLSAEHWSEATADSNQLSIGISGLARAAWDPPPQANVICMLRKL